MRTGLSDALDILRKFASERTLLESRFSFCLFAGAFRGRLAFSEPDEILLTSEDGGTRFAVRLSSPR